MCVYIPFLKPPPKGWLCRYALYFLSTHYLFVSNFFPSEKKGTASSHTFLFSYLMIFYAYSFRNPYSKYATPFGWRSSNQCQSSVRVIPAGNVIPCSVNDSAKNSSPESGTSKGISESSRHMASTTRLHKPNS